MRSMPRPQLTEAHLERLGLPLRPRLKLLKAIAALREGAGPSPGDQGLSRERPGRSSRPPGRAAPADGAFLRPGRLDGIVGPARPRRARTGGGRRDPEPFWDHSAATIGIFRRY